MHLPSYSAIFLLEAKYSIRMRHRVVAWGRFVLPQPLCTPSGAIGSTSIRSSCGWSHRVARSSEQITAKYGDDTSTGTGSNLTRRSGYLAIHFCCLHVEVTVTCYSCLSSDAAGRDNCHLLWVNDRLSQQSYWQWSPASTSSGQWTLAERKFFLILEENCQSYCYSVE